MFVCVRVCSCVDVVLCLLTVKHESTTQPCGLFPDVWRSANGMASSLQWIQLLLLPNANQSTGLPGTGMSLKYDTSSSANDIICFHPQRYLFSSSSILTIYLLGALSG